MKIIIAPDNPNLLDSAALALHITRRRLAGAAAAVLLLLVMVIYGAAYLLAAHWLETRAPAALALVAEMEERKNAERRRMWEDHISVFKDQIASLRANIIELGERGAALAVRVGLTDKRFFEAPLAIAEFDLLLANSVPQQNDAAALIAAAGLTRFDKALDYIDSRYDVIRRHGTETAVTYDTVPMKQPLAGKNWLSSGFGYRRDPFTGRRSFHSGYDYAARKGVSVLAGATGLVVYSGRLGNYGKAIRILHGGAISTLYGHLSASHVQAGQYVRRGEVIGKVGSTGRSSGPHLHYEVRRNNRPRSVAREISRIRKARAVPDSWKL